LDSYDLHGDTIVVWRKYPGMGIPLYIALMQLRRSKWQLE